jgi:Fe-S-cluster containining protein
MEKQHRFTGQDPLKQLLFENIQAKLQENPFVQSILPAFEQIMEFAGVIIEQLEASGQSPLVSCQCGCSYCCHSQVKIIPIEALSIYAYIKQTFNDIEISDLKKRILFFHGLTHEKTLEQRFSIKQKLPCIFLMSEQCCIYKARPSICRSWNSLEQSACITAYNSKNSQAEIESSPARNYVYGAAREIFELITRQQDLQTQTLHMHQAIDDCFNNPDPLTQWSRGIDIFKTG